MLSCAEMRLALGSTKDLVGELPWLALATLALVATLGLEHFLVHREIVLPALALTREPPFWMFAAMIVPELVVFFAAGYRLRTWLSVAMYAGVGAMIRSAFISVLERMGEPGHVGPAHEGLSELAATAPAVAFGYLLVLALAAWSGEDERRLAGGA